MSLRVFQLESECGRPCYVNADEKRPSAMYDIVMQSVEELPCPPQQLGIPSNLYYKVHQIPKFKYFSSCLAVFFAQCIEARG